MYLLIDFPIIALAFSGAALFAARFVRNASAEAHLARDIPFRTLGWYPRDRVDGTSSPRFRGFMRAHNRLTSAMWSCFLLAAATYLIGHAFANVF